MKTKKKGLKPGKRKRRRRHSASDENAAFLFGAAIGGIFSAMISDANIIDLKQKPEIVDFEVVEDE